VAVPPGDEPTRAARVVAGIAAVRARIARACAACGRDPGDVELVAVSKTHEPEAVRAAYEAGQRVFGENYVRELVDKAAALADLPGLRWHFIGHLQRNKVRDVIDAGAVVETVDSARLATALHERAARLGAGAVDVWVQVNVAREPQKSGCAPEEAEALVDAVRALPALRLRGLMTVPPAEGDPRPWFAALRALRDRVGVSGLSMGMSADLEAAIAEGTTLVRVGTAIFGERLRQSP
jgi:pyridoxal phosphate enzyme (YggS family)